MNIEQLRADFDVWINQSIYADDSESFHADLWNAYQAGRAALQPQVNSEAADRVREFLDKWMQIRLNDKTVIYRLNDLELRVDDLRALITTQSQDREDAERYRWIRDEAGLMVLPYDDHGMGPEFPCGSDLDAAIDHARNIVGGKDAISMD